MKYSNEWKKLRLEELGEIVGGGTPSTKREDYYLGGDIPWLTPKDLSGHNRKYISRGERNITELGLNNSSANLYPEGTVLFSSRAPIGYIAIASNEISTNQGFKSVIPNLDVATSDFIYYLLIHNTDKIKSISSGSTFKEISGSVMKKIQVMVPPIKEQKRITNLLSSFDDKIENNNAIISNLEEQAQAIFKSWFIDFEPFQDGNFVDSELGKIPESWEVKTLEDLAIYNKRGFSPKYSKIDEGIPVINQRCIRNNYIIEEAVRYHDSAKNYPEDKVFKAYDVLINSMGVGTLGRVAQSAETKGTKLVHSCITILRANKNLILPAIFGMLMMMNQSLFENMAEGTTGQTSLKNKAIAKLKFIIPPLSIQKEIESIFDNILRYKDLLYRQNENLVQLRDILLPKLMSGELRVGQDDIEYIESQI